MTHRFDEIIHTRERLREIVGQPSHAIVAKVIDHIDDICRKFIAASPFVIIATKGADGLIEVSPKGDPAGFVAVLDEKTLAIPDRVGNRRVDTFENLLVSSEIGLIFLIPGFSYTLRVSGHARLVRDAALAERLAVNSKPPDLILAVTVQEAFWHCAKCIARSRLWQPELWPDRQGIPSLAEAMVAHGKLTRSVGEQQSMIDADFATRMY
jgi:PPOX class probable FMN-dependent enzyme